MGVLSGILLISWPALGNKDVSGDVTVMWGEGDKSGGGRMGVIHGSNYMGVIHVFLCFKICFHRWWSIIFTQRIECKKNIPEY